MMKNVVGIQFVLLFQDRIETDRKTIERLFVNFLFEFSFPSFYGLLEYT